MACIRFNDPEITAQIAKYILFLFHGIFLVASSAVLVGSTYGWIQWRADADAFLTDQNLPNFFLAGIIAGCILTVLSVFGIITTLVESRCMLIVNILFLSASALFLICVGTSVFLIKRDLNEAVDTRNGALWDHLKSSWLRTVQDHPSAVCNMQTALECSGFTTGAPYGAVPGSVSPTELLELLEQPNSTEATQVPGWSSYCINPSNLNNADFRETTNRSKLEVGQRTSEHETGDSKVNADTEFYCTTYDGCSALYEMLPTEQLSYTDGCLEKVSDAIHIVYLSLGISSFGCALLGILTILTDCCLFYHHNVENDETISLIAGEMEMGYHRGKAPRGPRHSISSVSDTSDTERSSKFTRFVSYGTTGDVPATNSDIQSRLDADG